MDQIQSCSSKQQDFQQFQYSFDQALNLLENTGLKRTIVFVVLTAYGVWSLSLCLMEKKKDIY